MPKMTFGRMIALSAALASTQQPVSEKPYLPAGKRKPTFTEKRKAEAAARRTKKKRR